MYILDSHIRDESGEVPNQLDQNQTFACLILRKPFMARMTCELAQRLPNLLQNSPAISSNLRYFAMLSFNPPPVVDPAQVGEYAAEAMAGGGYVWDEVLEYRVWCHPERGAPDECDGSDYYYPFETYAEALEFSESNAGCEAPLALILQREYIDEPEPGQYHHIREPRIAEWPVEFLSRPRRTERTIPDFLAPGAPENRLAILRGLA